MKSEKWLASDGSQYWGDPGTEALHRVGGPAIITNHGEQIWYQNDVPHRIDGPAECLVPHSVYIYWVDGERMTQEQWKNHPLVVEHFLNQTLKELANEE